MRCEALLQRVRLLLVRTALHRLDRFTSDSPLDDGGQTQTEVRGKKCRPADPVVLIDVNHLVDERTRRRWRRVEEDRVAERDGLGIALRIEQPAALVERGVLVKRV